MTQDLTDAGAGADAGPTADLLGNLTGRSAVEIAALVHRGEVSPEDVVAEHLALIDAIDPLLNAFQVVMRDEALAGARTLADRGDLADLPLAGVPVAVKDDLDVAGQPTRKGSLATDVAPAGRDDEVVARLRRAGAVIVGKTRVPELMALPWTETLAFGATRNPWDPSRTPGGSSGGSGAAVAAGLVPLAVGSDGLGSIRIPAACCGLAGMKPGPGLVPRPRGAGEDWYGMSEHGPMATTVADTALMLSVMADRDDLREPPIPERPLRIATSTRPPSLGPPMPVHSAIRTAVQRTATALESAGHAVIEDDPPYPRDLTLWATQRWLGGVAADAEELPTSLLEPRTRTHVRLGGIVRRFLPPDERDTDTLRQDMNVWFRDHDVLVSPILAKLPVPVGAYHGAGHLRVSIGATMFIPFTPPWNLVGFPTAVVPAGVTKNGLPVGVQIVAPRGSEALVLAVAAQLERLRPWPRHAPGIVPVGSPAV